MAALDPPVPAGRVGAATFGAFLIAANGRLFGIHTSWSWYACVPEVVAVVVGVVAAAREAYLSQVTGRIGAGSA